MQFQVDITPSALAELKAVKAYHQRQIAAAIDNQFRHEPFVQTRNRKPIIGVEPDFEHVPPIWELRVGGHDMKAVDEADLQKNLTEYLDGLRTEPIVVTRAGKACAVLHNVASDVEAAELSHSAEFWRMIEERRREPTIPWDTAKRELAP